MIPLIYQYPHHNYGQQRAEEKVPVTVGGLWVLQFRAAKIAMPLVEHVTTETGEAGERPGRVDKTTR